MLPFGAMLFKVQLLFLTYLIEHGYKIIFQELPLPYSIDFPRFDMRLLLEEPLMSCLSVAVSEGFLVIQFFAILCMLPSSLQGNFVLL